MNIQKYCFLMMLLLLMKNIQGIYLGRTEINKYILIPRIGLDIV